MADEKIQLLHPDGRTAPRLDKSKYTLIRAILLDIVPRSTAGIPFIGLAGQVTKALTHEQLADLGSVGWLTTNVKLDLEARGEIERVPGSSPQRLRRK
jgi:Family of unknown function (DUF6958)